MGGDDVVSTRRGISRVWILIDCSLLAGKDYDEMWCSIAACVPECSVQTDEDSSSMHCTIAVRDSGDI